jgi:hypothetical protein
MQQQANSPLGALPSMAIHDRTARTIATLKQLARELNVPVEAFLRAPAEGEAGDLLTLVRGRVRQ